jgi:hypothetical protein
LRKPRGPSFLTTDRTWIETLSIAFRVVMARAASEKMEPSELRSSVRERPSRR